jgi:hypothetical protein
MGSSVKASCKCGYGESILIGGGMLNFKTTCLFPCLCEDCKEVVQGNLLAKRTKCPKCGKTGIIPYDDPKLIDWNVSGKLGRSLKLTNGDYLCPKCERFTMTFMDDGLCWD